MDEDLKIQVGLDIDDSKESEQKLLDRLNKKVSTLEGKTSKVKVKIGEITFDKGFNLNSAIAGKLEPINLKFDEKKAISDAENLAQKLKNILSISPTIAVKSENDNKGNNGAEQKLSQELTKEQKKLNYIQAFLQTYADRYKKTVKDVSEISFVPVDKEDSTQIELATGKLVSLSKVYEHIVSIAKKARGFDGLVNSEIKEMLDLSALYYQSGGNKTFKGQFPSDISLEKLLGGFKEVAKESQKVKNNISNISDAVEKSTSKATKKTSPTEQLSQAVETETTKQQIEAISGSLESLKSILSDPEFKNQFTTNVTNDFSTMKDNVTQSIADITAQIEKLMETLSLEFSIGDGSKISQNIEELAKKAVDETVKAAGSENSRTGSSTGTGSGTKKKTTKKTKRVDPNILSFSETSDSGELEKAIRDYAAKENKSVLNIDKSNLRDAEGNIKNLTIELKDANDQIEKLSFKLVDLGNKKVLQHTTTEIIQYAETIQEYAAKVKSALIAMDNPEVSAKDAKNLQDSEIIKYREAISQLIADGQKAIDDAVTFGASKDDIQKILTSQTALIKEQLEKIKQRNTELNKATPKKPVTPTGMATYEVRDVDKVESELKSKIEAKGDTVLSIDTDGLVDAEGRIKKVTIAAEDANHTLKEMIFTLKGTGDNSFLENTQTKIISLEDRAEKAKEALQNMVSEAAISSGGQISSDGSIDTSKIDITLVGQATAVNRAYTESIGAIENALNDPNLTQDKLSEIIKRQTNEVQTQVKALNKYEGKLESLSKLLNTVEGVSKSNALKGQATQYKQEIEQIRSAVFDTSKDGFVAPDTEALDKYITRLRQIQSEFVKIKAQNKDDLFETKRDTTITKLRAELTSWTKNKNVANDPESLGKIQEILAKVNTSYLTTSERISEVRAQTSALKKELQSSGKLTMSFTEKLEANIAKFSSWLGVSQLVMKGIETVKKMVSTVTTLDKSLTDLQIASGFTKTQVDGLLDSYVDLAKQLGTTTTSILSSADSWVRQGYSIEETNQLIANSTMLAKLGQVETAEATQYLTSAIKGYNVSVNDSLEIVDKLTAVDREAAVSAGGLAEAMSRTAAGAKLAGVDMNKLIGYAATIGETTQRSMETVGESLKSIFARMGNIKAGNLSDPETGESLSNVETALKSAGIKLRDSNSEFRNFGEVLDEIAAKWDSLSSVQQRAVASALAGTHQYENFLVLMQNYDTALEYAQVAADSNGTSLEKYTIVQDGVEARTQKMIASFEDLARTIVDSDWIKTAVSGLTSISEGVKNVVDTFGLLPTVITTASAAMSLLGKNDGGLFMPSYWEMEIN